LRLCSEIGDSYPAIGSSNSSDGFMRGQVGYRCGNDKAVHDMPAAIAMPSEKAVTTECDHNAFTMAAP